MIAGDVIVGNGQHLDGLPAGSLIRREDDAERAPGGEWRALIRVAGLWSRFDDHGRPTGNRFGVGSGRWRIVRVGP